MPERVHLGSPEHMSYSLNSLKGDYIGDYIGFRDLGFRV